MINRISHVELAVTDLAASKEFYAGALGFVVHAETAAALWLRAPNEFDVWSLKLTLDREAGLLGFGFRTAREEDLDELAALHAERGLAHRWVGAGEEPGRGRALRVLAPTGHVVDFQHEIAEVSAVGVDGIHMPMRNTHLQRGVMPARIDHINVRVTDIDAALDYWQHGLDFSPSELHVERDGRTRRAWLRRAPFSHDLAMGRDDAPGFHHVAYAMSDPNGLMRAADILADGGWDVIEYGPGRHGITDGHFLYVRDPDANRIELYGGDYVRDLDRPPIVWGHDEYEARGLLWWGQQPPASFLLAGPVLDRGLVDETPASTV